MKISKVTIREGIIVIKDSNRSHNSGGTVMSFELTNAMSKPNTADDTIDIGIRVTEYMRRKTAVNAISLRWRWAQI